MLGTEFFGSVLARRSCRQYLRLVQQRQRHTGAVAFHDLGKIKRAPAGIRQGSGPGRQATRYHAMPGAAHITHAACFRQAYRS